MFSVMFTIRLQALLSSTIICTLFLFSVGARKVGGRAGGGGGGETIFLKYINVARDQFFFQKKLMDIIPLCVSTDTPVLDFW